LKNFSGSTDDNSIEGKIYGGGPKVDVRASSGRINVSFRVGGRGNVRIKKYGSQNSNIHHITKHNTCSEISSRPTIRGLSKNRTYSFLNIFGLAIGIACAGLIFLWVEDELNYDGFNVNKDRLYFARVNARLDAGVFTHWSTPGVLGPAIQSEIPGIANTCRTSEDQTKLLFTIGDRSVYASGKYAEPSLFSMFHVTIQSGKR
jgi:hypothetical protein